MLYYEKINNNSDKWVLFIHGLGGSIETWKYQLEDFRSYNIIRVDLMGHGKSALVKGSADTATVKEIKAILDENGIDMVNIVSLSLGTLVAVEFAHLYPEMTGSIILGGSILNLSLSRKMLLGFVRILWFLPARWIYSIFARIMLPNENHKKSRRIFVRESLKMKNSAFWAWLSAISPSRKKLAALLDTLKARLNRVLFISGDEDFMFLPGIRNLKEKLHSCRIELLKKCGHICSIEQHEKFDRLSLQFLADTAR